MTWTYVQSTGRLYRPDGTHAATGYAGGGGGARPDAVNNHAMQMIRGIGPIPVGTYTLGDAVMQSQLGQFAIPLLPDIGNVMFGRSAFYMHGDKIEGPSRSASDGCIIMPRSVRDEVYTSDDRRVVVVEIKERI
jgi:hypothetical protein